RRWLKPALHSVYGLHGATPRRHKAAYTHINSPRAVQACYTIQGVPFDCWEIATEKAKTIPTANVLTLGVLQAEVRKRTMELANAITEIGGTVLYIHADGFHVDMQNCPPFGPGEGWKITPLTDVMYVDDVSWVANESD